MKKIILLFLLVLVVSLFGCSNEKSFDKSKSNLNYSEQFVDEETISNINKPQIVIVFKNTSDIEKSVINDELNIEQVKDIIKQQRQKNKEFYSKNNQELFQSMFLNLEKEKVYISNYSNCVFIELDDSKSSNFYDELMKKIGSYNFVLETYLNKK